MKLLRIRSILNIFALITSALLAVVGCGGDSGKPDVDATYTVAGSLSGLRSGSTITLLSTSSTMTNWTKTTISGNGRFTLDMPVKYNGSYSITVGDQPPGQTCSVVNGSGAGVVSDVSSAAVVCSDLPIKISGTVSGLDAGKFLRLLNNGADSTTISSNGPFEFALPVALSGSYLATVLTQPSNQTCTVNNGSGSGVIANVSNIAVVCSDARFVISGKVVGLNTGTRLTLLNNAVDPVTLSEDGAFKFPVPIAFNGSYAVTVATQPLGKTCTVNAGSGAGITADVSTVAVLCSDTTYSVSGTVSGLGSGKQVTLFNSRADPITVKGNETFRFPTPIVSGGNYAVTVGTQPNGQVCTVNNGSGSGVIANVSDIAVVCSDARFVISGKVVGLNTGTRLTLLNNAVDPVTLSEDGAFKFPVPIAFNGSYAVTVATQPLGKTCTVNAGSGAGITADVSTVAVLCSDTTYSVSGTVSGLGSGKQVTLFNSRADPITVKGNETFRFPAPIVSGGNYSVTVGTQPNGQVCTVNDGTGAGVTLSVINVAVVCSDTSYKVSGTVSGLGSGKQLTILNNDANPLIVSNSGPFTFSTGVAFNQNYAVTVGTQPPGQTCTVYDGKGKVTSDVSSVTLICADSPPRVSGSVSGLSAGNFLVLQNKGTDNIAIVSNGPFSFSPSTSSNDYLVTIYRQPPTQTCFVNYGAGLVTAANPVIIQCVNGTGLTGAGN